MGRQPHLLAVNHWDIAIETHALNHPWARHLCAALDAIDPRKAVPSGRLNLLVASPECTHFSVARGGRPMHDQSRASAWLILKWLQELYVDNVLIENVREFENWGPLGADRRPMKSKRGETFNAFIAALRSLGYKVEWRLLNAADYGDPTTRERLFVIARRGNRKIAWPEPSHAPAERLRNRDLFERLAPWRPAREIIDWSIKGDSIFRRKRPLAPATMERIAAGIRKFRWPEPFLLILRNHMDGKSLDEPIPTLAAGGQHVGLVEPFILGQQSGSVARSTSDPVPTIATDGAISLVQPFIMPLNHGRADHRSNGMHNPFPTVTSTDAWGMVEPFIMSFYGHGQTDPVSDPLNTITAKDRFGIVRPATADILFRMLQPHELAAAMSFPPEYQFAGNRQDKVKQIGNAVPVRTATALCRAILEDR